MRKSPFFSFLSCRAALVAVAMLSAFEMSAQGQTPMTPEEDREYRNAPVKGFRIVDNIYFVGPTLHNPSYLLTTPDGHILIDTAYEKSVQPIRENIEGLGFRLRDVKLLLSSHAHRDHVGGHALMKELTGATVLSSEADADVIRSGGKTDFRDSAFWKPGQVDRYIQDGQRVELGGTTLVAHFTPGHTKGATTWTTVAEEGGRQYDVVFFSGARLNENVPLFDNPKYPNIVEDFAKTFAKLKTLPCDIYLGFHGYWFGIRKKIKRLEQGHGVRSFVDPQGYWDFVEVNERAYLERLEAERASR